MSALNTENDFDTPAQEWIDGLCLSWDNERSALLGALIREDRLVANDSNKRRALSALKSKSEPILVNEREKLIDDWLRACRDSDSEIRQFAESVFKKHSDPVYFFLYEQWDCFQSTAKSWENILDFYRRTDTGWKELMRAVAVQNKRLDWVTAMTSELNDGMIPAFDDDRLKLLNAAEAEAIVKVLLEHKRWRDSGHCLRTIDSVIGDDGWKRIIEHCKSLNEEAVWHLSSLCPPKFSHACFAILVDTEWQSESPSDLECLTRLCTLASQCKPPIKRLAPATGYPKGRESTCLTNVSRDTNFVEEIHFLETSLILRKYTNDYLLQPSYTSKYLSVEWEPIYIACGLGCSSQFGIYYFGSNHVVLPGQQTARPHTFLVIGEVLGSIPPHAISIEQLQMLEADRHLLTDSQDKNWALFLLEVVYWAQRQQRIAKNGSPELRIEGSYRLLNSSSEDNESLRMEKREQQEHGAIELDKGQ